MFFTVFFIINNDENVKKGTGQFGIIMYSYRKPEIVGQISQIYNERKDGKEKELNVFGNNVVVWMLNTPLIQTQLKSQNNDYSIKL